MSEDGNGALNPCSREGTAGSRDWWAGGAPTLKILGKSGDFPIWTFRLARRARVLPRKRTASKGEASEVTGSVVPGSQNWWSCTPARTPGMFTHDVFGETVMYPAVCCRSIAFRTRGGRERKMLR